MGLHVLFNRTEAVIVELSAPASQTAVTTAEPTSITAESAVVGGTVTVPEGSHVFLRGVCWGTEPIPDIDGSHTTEETGIGSFSSTLDGLNPNTTYYVRAYAVSDHGLAYGNELSFTTLSGIPVVTTAEVTDVTGNSALCGGTVTDDGGMAITARGVCWSTSHDPTLGDSHTTDGMGTGSFTSSLTGLSTGTTYYVRAYATTAQATSYGEEMTFTTMNGIPTVSTAEVTDITATTATCGGTIATDGGLAITARGVCWSTSHNPTLSDSHTTDGSGTGSFTSSLTGLSASTTYYVRAYASNSLVTIYGGEQSFTTEAGGGSGGDAPTGAIDGKFTINSSGDQVYFSQGNLQYIGSAATPYWKFADNQWDILGTTTGQNSSDQNVDRDLFGWGTSGWNNGNTYYRPWDTNNSSGSSYGPPGQYDLTGSYANADWGVYNPIINGGNQANQWRTLTQPEWAYIFNTRTTNSGIRYAKARVNNMNGVILLPDDWSSDTYSLSNTNSTGASFSSNTISASQWNTLEQAGAVFLPAAGARVGTSVDSVGSFGDYWSASYCSSSYAFDVVFSGSGLSLQVSYYRDYGQGVRLVCPAEN